MSRCKLELIGLIIALSFFVAALGGGQEIGQPSDGMIEVAVENASEAALDGQNVESPYFVMDLATDQAETLTCTLVEGSPTDADETANSSLANVNPEADINVGDLPVCTITVEKGSVCAYSTGNIAYVPYHAGATYSWSVTNGVITSGQYTSQIKWDALSNSPATISVTVTRNYGSACCTCSNSVSVQVNPKPDCTISTQSSVCARSTALTASVPDQPGATYTWAITNGIIVSGQGSPSITWDAGDMGPITIGVTVSQSDGATVCTCKNSVQIDVVKNPDCTITAPTGVCALSTGNTASVIPQWGSTYVWTATNGEITSGQGTNLITWKAANVSPATIAVTITKTAGGTKCICSSSKDVQIYQNPDCTITAPSGVCAGSHNNHASVPAAPGASFAWTVSNGQIISGQGTNQIQWQPTGSSQVTISVAVSQYYGSKHCSCSNTVQVQVYANPECTITAPKNVLSNQKNNKASVSNQDPATYEWTITNGVITSGQNTHEITWDALATSPVTIKAKIIKDYGSTQCSCSG
jgi:hypothetical protein